MTTGVSTGVTGILATPFNSDMSIDHAALAHQADAALGWGSVAVGFGFASEVHRLTEAEQLEAVATVASTVGGRAPVMAHVWTGSLAALTARLSAVADAGASLAMVPAPPLVPLDLHGAESFFLAAADASPVPVVVQDAPAITGSPIGVEVLARLLVHPNVAAVKIEALPSAPKVGAVAAASGRAAGILGGGGGLDFWHELRRGASGTMPSAALPEPFARVLQLHTSGDLEPARTIFNRLVPLLSLSQRSFDTYATVQKWVLMKRGAMPSARLRPPSQDDSELLAEMEALWPDIEGLLRDLDE